ncbi:TPA: type 1 fimbrial protein [Escherichia coli]|nr:type 1 fimbrial protein [Escherichia coli]
MKKIIIFSALSSMLAISGVQAEGHGTINFTGTVNSQTCNASINGSSGATPATVVLPTVQADVLGTLGKTAGQTAFKIDVTSCNVSSQSSANTVKAYFEKGAGVDGNGRLINTASNGASNVVLELVGGTSNPINVGDISQSSDSYVAISDGNATLPYSVRYYATGKASAGPVESRVTYSLIYK